MSTRPQFKPDRQLSEILAADETLSSTMFHHGAMIERLPLALTYAANLESQDSAVLFYDNLVVAAEYFCAFIEEGIRRHEVTYLTGLEPTRYRTMFDQVGIKVEELENCGYLRNLSADSFLLEAEHTEKSQRDDDPLRTGLEDELAGIRFLHIQNPPQENWHEHMKELERKVHRFSSFPTTSICCYEARALLDMTSTSFRDLLEAHDHCLFQGSAMPTSRLLDLRRSSVYPGLKST